MRKLILVAVGASIFGARVARGEPCATDGQPVVAFDAPEGPTRTLVGRELRASLATRAIALCDASAVGEGQPTAFLEVMLEGETGLTLTVRDRVTNKRVARDVDLAPIPRDARPLAIALAADELLRATWAELLLVDAKPAAPVPSAVTRAVTPAPPREAAPAVAPAPAPLIALDVGLVGERYGGGHAQGGLDVGLSAFPWSRVGARVRGGPRFGKSETTAGGELSTSSWVFAGGVVVGVLPRSGRFGVDVATEIVLNALALDARTEAYGPRSDAALAVHAGVAPSVWAVLTAPVRLVLAAEIGAPLRTTRVVDGSATVSSTAGVMLGGALSLQGTFAP